MALIKTVNGANAPNIIIPVEHQAAPKYPVIEPLRAAPIRRATPAAGDYDAELDNPLYEHPDVLAWEERAPGKSTDGMIEESERQFYLTQQRMKAYTWEGQERWQGRQNEAARLTRILHANRFIAMLQAAGVAAALANPHCDAQLRDGVAEPLDDGNCRLWLSEYSRVGRVGVNAWVKPAEGTRAYLLSRRVARTVTTLQYPLGPEFTVMRFDRYNVPTAEKYRGWRTAVLALILTEVITEEEAERAFGPVIGAAGEFYREQLHRARAIRLGVETQ